MKRTALFDLHRASGAKMISFAGFEMPLEYPTGITKEHMAARYDAAIFDVSHMGILMVKGSAARDYLQKVSTNDVSRLTPGKAQYSCMLNQEGGIIDDFLVYNLKENEYLLVVNAANTTRDWEWLNIQNRYGVRLENLTCAHSIISIQGPKAINVLRKFVDFEPGNVASFNFETGTVCGVNGVIISKTGYTGAGGFELITENPGAEKIWQAFTKEGSSEGLIPAGLGARDTLRLEMGYCLHGNDIDENISPLMAGLGWITKFVDEKPFIGREALEVQLRRGVERELKGFVMKDRGIPRKGYLIHESGGEVIGQVTSGSFSPVLQKGIGLGYINAGHGANGSEIEIVIRDSTPKAIITPPPFVKPWG